MTDPVQLAAASDYCLSWTEPLRWRWLGVFIGSLLLRTCLGWFGLVLDILFQHGDLVSENRSLTAAEFCCWTGPFGSETNSRTLGLFRSETEPPQINVGSCFAYSAPFITSGNSRESDWSFKCISYWSNPSSSSSSSSSVLQSWQEFYCSFCYFRWFCLQVESTAELRIFLFLKQTRKVKTQQIGSETL